MNTDITTTLWALGITGRAHHVRDLRGLARGLTATGADLSASFFPDAVTWGQGPGSLGAWVVDAYTSFIQRREVGQVA